MSICAIILTKNEAIHLPRCMAALAMLVDEIYVVDSFSTDGTVSIATSHGASILQNPWKNYATQLNWAIDNIKTDCDWLLRIDADEYFDATSCNHLLGIAASAAPVVGGVYVCRHIVFMGKRIRFGAVGTTHQLRLWRKGQGQCENRWMDEHIRLRTGSTIVCDAHLFDDNLNSLSWWIEKHNSYASREAVDSLNHQYALLPPEKSESLPAHTQAKRKRWLKENVYARMPLGVRPIVYFFYRYVVAGGFLDGVRGFIFHFMQGLWYRLLVDAKQFECVSFAKDNNVDLADAIKVKLGISIRQ